MGLKMYYCINLLKNRREGVVFCSRSTESDGVLFEEEFPDVVSQSSSCKFIRWAVTGLISTAALNVDARAAA